MIDQGSNNATKSGTTRQTGSSKYAIILLIGSVGVFVAVVGLWGYLIFSNRSESSVQLTDAGEVTKVNVGDSRSSTRDDGDLLNSNSEDGAGEFKRTSDDSSVKDGGSSGNATTGTNSGSGVGSAALVVDVGSLSSADQEEYKQQIIDFQSFDNQLKVTGKYSSELSITFAYWFAQLNTDLVPFAPGDYTFTYYDDGGSELYSFNMDGKAFSYPNPESFEFYIPYPHGTKKVKLSYKGSVLTSKTKSDNLPKVVITSPAANEVVTGNSFTIGWSGSDPDNSPLQYTVLYSDNNELSGYQVAASALMGNSYSMPLTDINNGPLYFMIVVSDGFNSYETGINKVIVVKE